MVVAALNVIDHAHSGIMSMCRSAVVNRTHWFRSAVIQHSPASPQLRLSHRVQLGKLAARVRGVSNTPNMTIHMFVYGPGFILGEGSTGTKRVVLDSGAVDSPTSARVTGTTSSNPTKRSQELFAAKTPPRQKENGGRMTQK
jgi:hypothetical protein